MRRMLEEQGIAPAKILTEVDSRSTYENAVYCARILQSRGINQVALVTDADSMLRAEKCFRKQGIRVTPAPCFFWDLRLVPGDLLPGWQGIYRSEILAHKGLGLVWYGLRGRI